MGWKSFDVVRFHLSAPHPLPRPLQGQMWIAKFESAYNLIVFGGKDLEYKIK